MGNVDTDYVVRGGADCFASKMKTVLYGRPLWHRADKALRSPVVANTIGVRFVCDWLMWLATFTQQQRLVRQKLEHRLRSTDETTKHKYGLCNHQTILTNIFAVALRRNSSRIADRIYWFRTSKIELIGKISNFRFSAYIHNIWCGLAAWADCFHIISMNLPYQCSRCKISTNESN